MILNSEINLGRLGWQTSSRDPKIFLQFTFSVNNLHLGHNWLVHDSVPRLTEKYQTIFFPISLQSATLRIRSVSLLHKFTTFPLESWSQRARPQIALPKTSFIFLTVCEAYLGNYWLTCFLNQFENGFECVNKTLKVNGGFEFWQLNRHRETQFDQRGSYAKLLRRG